MNRFTVIEQWEVIEIKIMKKYSLVPKAPRKSLFLSFANSKCFGICSRTALSMDKDFGPEKNVNILSSTPVKLCIERTPLARVVLWDIR